MSRAPGEIIQTYSSHKATSDDDSQSTEVSRLLLPLTNHGSEEIRSAQEKHGRNSEHQDNRTARISRTRDQEHPSRVYQ